ncbi:MAG: hypothetical protein ABSC92_14765 [Rhizomicrobium sp.]|jgi:hypothetical protein
MSLRFPLAAAAALMVLGVLSAPASAIQTIQIPDPTAPANANGTAPDALFDNSIPDSWQKKGDSSNSQFNTGGFHFSVRSSSSYGGYEPSSSSTYHDPLVPGSEFYQPLPGTDPIYPH